MDDEKIIDPRYIERLRSLPKSNRDDKQDTMALAMAGQAVFHPDSQFVSIEARSHVNTMPEMPRDPDIFKPTKSNLDFLSEQNKREIEKYLAKFGEQNGYPVIFVTTFRRFEPPKEDIVHEAFINTEVNIQMFKKSGMREAADFARRNGGEIGTFDNRCAEKIYNDEYLQQPVLDGQLPKFCIAHHCTERGPKCDKCAYTAMATHEKAKANDSFYKTTQVTRAILLLIEEEMKRQGVGRIEDLKCPDRSTEERLQLEQRLKQAVEKEPVKMVVPSSICAPGYESGLAARQKEEQKKCPYCHDFDGHGPDLFKCNSDYETASINLEDNTITFDNSDGSRMSGAFKIKLCPMCGRKLEELR